MSDKDAGGNAADAQIRGMQKGIEEQRRQFDRVRDDLMPFMEAGTEMLPQFSENASVGGFADNLDQLMNSDALDPMIDQRREAINAEFANKGLLNSSARAEGIADDLSKFTMGIEEMLNQRQGNLVGIGQGSANQLGNFGQSMANNVSQMQQGIGQARGQGIISDAQADTQMTNQLLGLGTSALGGAIGGGMGVAGMQDSGGSPIGSLAGAGLGLMFSDAKLKTNIRETGEVGPLTVYEWDWVPELDAIGLKPDMTRGFLAEDVERIFPEYVHPVGPFKAVDYPRLMDKLDEVLH